jgi:hypothetical protein
MSLFYSILFTPINPVTGERVNLALLVNDGRQIWMKYSLSRLQVIKQLISSDASASIHSYLKELNKHFSGKQPLQNELDVAKWDRNYFYRMSNYSSNLISFTEPKEIDVEPAESNYQKIFQKYIHPSEQFAEKPHLKSGQDEIKKKLYPLIKERVNTDVELKPDDLSSLMFPALVNIIGRNKIPVAGNILDFSQRHDYLENNLENLLQ